MEKKDTILYYINMSRAHEALKIMNADYNEPHIKDAQHKLVCENEHDNAYYPNVYS